MTRAFFDQIDDEVRGMVGPRLRNFHAERSGRLIKVWYDQPPLHFEVQRLAGKWAPRPQPCLEIGFHIEFRDPNRNMQVLSRLVDAQDSWRAVLPQAQPGRAFGPMSASWRRVSEVVDLPALDEDFAGEAAERLAGYIRTLHPLIGG